MENMDPPVCSAYGKKPRNRCPCEPFDRDPEGLGEGCSHASDMMVMVTGCGVCLQRLCLDMVGVALTTLDDSFRLPCLRKWLRRILG